MATSRPIALPPEPPGAELADLVGRLEPADQAIVLAQLRKAQAGQSALDEVSLFHSSLKAQVDGDESKKYEEIQSAKAPPVLKEFPNHRHFALPRDLASLPFTLDRVMKARASRRDFTHLPLSQQELSTLLHYTYGIRKRITAYNTREFPVRMSPSSGGLQAVEMYLVVNAVEQLPKGLYHYNPATHGLTLLNQGNMRFKVVKSCLYQDWLAHAGIVVVLTCVMDRVLWKYGPRGYRFVHVDTGVLASHLYLVATALKLRTCAVAAFQDDLVNDLLEIDGRNEFTTLVVPVGKRPQAPEDDDGAPVVP